MCEEMLTIDVSFVSSQGIHPQEARDGQLHQVRSSEQSIGELSNGRLRGIFAGNGLFRIGSKIEARSDSHLGSLRPIPKKTQAHSDCHLPKWSFH